MTVSQRIKLFVITRQIIFNEIHMLNNILKNKTNRDLFKVFNEYKVLLVKANMS